MGCEGCFDFDIEPLGNGCLFDIDFETAIDSDNGVLRAVVDCEPGADCTESHDVIVGSRFEYSIEVPTRLAGEEQRVSGTSGTELSGYDTQNDRCDDAVQLIGEVSFTEPGPASVRVYGDDVLLDSFTVSVWEPAALDLQAAEGTAAFGTVITEDGGISTGYFSYPAGSTLSIDTVHALRAFVRNEDGERLVGATGFSWHIADPRIARISDGEDGQRATLTPLANGRTTLRATGGGLSIEIQLEVTGAAISFEDEDAGTHDASAEDESMRGL